MNFLSKMERRFGKYAIRNLTMIIIACYAIGYVLLFVNPALLSYLELEPALVLKGQIWRLFTWIVVPSSSFDIFTIIMLFFYFSIGVSLERTWGDFRYNVYIIGGLILTILGAFIAYGITGMMYGFSNAAQISIGAYTSTYYISMSIFLAFAATYPNMQVLLFFVLPIRVKWLGVVYAATILYTIITYLRSGGWFVCIPIVMSMLNFIIFFLMTRNMKRFSPKEIHRKQEFKKAVTQPKMKPNTARHRCCICGRTELDDPNLEFRFCSKCSGSHEYCQDHLFTHEHIK